MQFFRHLLARLARWRSARRRPASRLVTVPLTIVHAAPVYREVTRDSVKVYSLCGCCGSRLRASATLCDECAQRQSRPARPY